MCSSCLGSQISHVDLNKERNSSQKSWLAMLDPLHRRERVKPLQAAAIDKILNSPDPGGFMEGKQLSVVSVGIRETQEMLSGSDRDGDAEYPFLHFTSGIRTSCREDRT